MRGGNSHDLLWITLIYVYVYVYVYDHREASLLQIRKASNSVYLLYLHYRIITRIVITNKFLFCYPAVGEQLLYIL